MGLPTTGAVMQDGSGLSRADQATCSELLGVLDLAQKPGFQAIADGLAVAGRTGTLAARYGGSPVAGKLRAKTGSLANAGGMVGVLSLTRTLHFAFLINQPLNDSPTPGQGGRGRGRPGHLPGGRVEAIPGRYGAVPRARGGTVDTAGLNPATFGHEGSNPSAPTSASDQRACSPPLRRESATDPSATGSGDQWSRPAGEVGQLTQGTDRHRGRSSCTTTTTASTRPAAIAHRPRSVAAAPTTSAVKRRSSTVNRTS